MIISLHDPLTSPIIQINTKTEGDYILSRSVCDKSLSLEKWWQKNKTLNTISTVQNSDMLCIGAI
jgi:hypothetical protein